jgi:4-diphosphocytidyl-2-C-methyl-D-erythritol kinase
VLVALNRIWNTGFSRAELTQLGLALGADVPLFVGGRSAWGEGVGERLLPTILPEQQYCVIWPEVSVSTGIIFSDRELTRNSPRIRIPGPFEGDRRNDLEPVARRQFSEVGQCLDWLGKFGSTRMSGSGSAAFVAVVDSHAGQQILDQLPAIYSGLVARGINQNPAFADESDGV